MLSHNRGRCGRYIFLGPPNIAPKVHGASPFFQMFHISGR